LPVPNSQYFYMEDATYCNDTSPPEAPEGWYSINLFFRVDICSSKTVSLIQSKFSYGVNPIVWQNFNISPSRPNEY
jgi:hypothetical protein